MYKSTYRPFTYIDIDNVYKSTYRNLPTDHLLTYKSTYRQGINLPTDHLLI